MKIGVAALLRITSAACLLFAGCAHEPVLDGSATDGDRNWRSIRRELAKTERGLGLRPLAKTCRAGSPDTVAFVRMRFKSSSSSDEDALILEAATATSPSSFTQMQDRRRGDGPGKPGTLVARNKMAPDDALARIARLDALGLRRFPAKVSDPGSTSLHTPIWVLQSCLEGEYRMTYSAINPGELRIDGDKPSEFHQAVAQLLELAKLPSGR